MTTIQSTKTNFAKYRTVLGIFVGFLTWLVLALFLKMPGAYTPSICILITLVISHTFEPKRGAFMGAILGVIPGLIVGLQLVFQGIVGSDIFELLATMIGAGLVTLYYIAVFTFNGLVFGSIIKLFKSGAIF